MDISEAAEKFEALFGEVLMGLPQRISQTGEEYIEFTQDGIYTSGIEHSVYDFRTDKRVTGWTIHANLDDASNAWLDEASKFALPLLPKTKTLYWRIKPEADYGHLEIHASNGLFRMPTWKIYSRFLISDKPRIS